jgi:hypothetical protein
MGDPSAERLLSGRAWEDFCETLKVAGRQIGRWEKVGLTDLDRAEWYRHLSRLARNGFERFVENCEPDRPRLRDIPWRTTINVTNPDQTHLLAEFDSAREYRITGNRGSVPYFVLAAWSAKQPRDLAARDWAARGIEGLTEFDPATLQTTAFRQSDAIHFDAQGNFEVIASREKKPGDWLPLRDDTVGLLLRVVHHEREKERAPVVRIERLDRPTPRPPLPSEVSAGLAKAAQMVLGYAELERAWWQDNLGQRPNRLRFSRQTYLSNGGVPDRHFAFGTWQVGDGEALVLHFTPPECEYWIFQLCNVWQENLDNYEDGQGYVTKFSARYEPGGGVRVVIAERDPGLGGNWVDRYGHTQGIMGLRLIKTASAPPVTVHQTTLRALEAKGWKALDESEAISTGELTE